MELTRENLTSRKSIAIGSGEYRFHPELQHGFTEMVMAVQGIEALIEILAADWSAQVPDAANWAPETAGGFAARIVGAKYMATEAAFKVVDQAVDICGDFGVARGGELERLFRDARMGRLHPATSPVAHEVVAKIHLGIDPDIQPRWG